MTKTEKILTVGIVAPLVLEIGGQVIGALHQGLGFETSIAGLLRGVNAYFDGWYLIGQGAVDLAYHPTQPAVLWNQMYGLSPNAAQTLSPEATAVRAGGYLSFASLLGYSAKSWLELGKGAIRWNRERKARRSAK